MWKIVAALSLASFVFAAGPAEARRHKHSHRIEKQECHPLDFSCGQVRLERPRSRWRGWTENHGGISPELAAKAAQISAACGSKIISGVRHTRVRHTRRMSLHASGRAVDMSGNPSCIYAQLGGWPGGYSTDYGRVKHVHISLGGREDGLRFRHGGKHKKKYRHKRHRRG